METKVKRIKKVFGNIDKFVHLWAHQTQTEARCKNAYFDGRSIYSYGSHYCLGYLIQYKGKTVALINDDGYSVTTAKHIGTAWHAVSHMPRVKVSGSDISSIKNQDDRESEIKAVVEDALIETQGKLLAMIFDTFNRTKYYQGYSFEANDYQMELIKEFNSTCKVFGLKQLCLEFDMDYMLALLNDHVAFRQTRQAELNTPEQLAKREAAKQRREELALVKVADKIESWRGGASHFPSEGHTRFELIRVMTKISDGSQDVQTSRGATVPLTHAIRLLQRIESLRFKNGDKVGHFSLDSVTSRHDGEECGVNELSPEDTILKIGCHRITLAEARTVLAPYMDKGLKLVESKEA